MKHKKGSEEMSEMATVISQFISENGFPIVSCCIMFWLYYREQEMHKQESKEFAEAINALSNVISKLSEKLGGT